MLKTSINCWNNSIREATNSRSDTDCTVKMPIVSQSASNLLIPSILGKQEVQRLNRKPMYKVDETFFDMWSETMAYVLGYLYADGNIYRDRCRFGISSKDCGHLSKIACVMKCDIPIRSQENSLGKWCTLGISRKHMTDRLRKLGLTANKSLSMMYPDVPADLMNHFVRGYFDGDGSVYKYKNKPNAMQVDFACGSETFISSLLQVLTHDIGNYYRVTHPRPNYYRLRGATEGSKRLFYYMYTGSSIYMDRKYNKFLECASIHGDDIVQTRNLELRSSTARAGVRSGEYPTQDLDVDGGSYTLPRNTVMC